MFGWRRNSQTRRIERIPAAPPRPPPTPPTTPNFGHECVEAIYQTLFPDIIKNGGLIKQDQREKSICFENGAFVFEDNNLSLFKILIGDKGTDTNTDEEYGILKGLKLFPRASRKHLTHLIPQILKNKQGTVKDGWGKITYIFYGPNDEKTEVYVASNLGNIVQYERDVYPKIKFLCNPQCRRPAPLPPYCHHIPQKKHGKGVIKFYSYSIRYTTPQVPPMEVGPYTYLKLESFPASPELDPFGVGAKQHGKRWREKIFSRGRKDAKAAMIKGECFKKKSQAYCYRAEDRGYVTNNEINQTKLTKYNNERNFLSQDGLSRDASNAIIKYTAAYVEHHGTQRYIYKLRTGQELFVPQQLTTYIVRELMHSYDIYNVHNVRPLSGSKDDAAASPTEIPPPPPLSRQKTPTIQDWVAALTPPRTGGTRKRRRKTRKRRRTKRHKRKYRRKRTRRTRKKKN